MQSSCLAARSTHQTLSFLHDDDDFQQPDGRKRPRPGVVGRPDYRKSPCGKMLNEEADQLWIPGSSKANLFLLFEMLMVDVQCMSGIRTLPLMMLQGVKQSSWN